MTPHVSREGRLGSWNWTQMEMQADLLLIWLALIVGLGAAAIFSKGRWWRDGWSRPSMVDAAVRPERYRTSAATACGCAAARLKRTRLCVRVCAFFRRNHHLNCSISAFQHGERPARAWAGWQGFTISLPVGSWKVFHSFVIDYDIPFAYERPLCAVILSRPIHPSRRGGRRNKRLRRTSCSIAL